MPTGSLTSCLPFYDWLVGSVVLADAGTHTSWQDWIPAYAESTPRIGKKCSGGNDGGRKMGSRLRGEAPLALDKRARGNDRIGLPLQDAMHRRFDVSVTAAESSQQFVR